MGLDPLSWAVIGSAVLGAGTSIATSVDSARRQRNAAADAAKQAQQQADQATQEAQKQNDIMTNRSNQRRADSSAATPGLGLGTTMLTGPQGVAGNQLHLGKSTLLGQ